MNEEEPKLDAMPEEDEEDEILETEGSVEQTRPETEEWIELPSGEALSESEAEDVMKVWPTKVILIAGENDVGKTSLQCGIYERFLNGRFAGQKFAGSRTLRAFEERSFLQRAESERSEPDMERTRLPAGQTQLLHLDLEANSDRERRSLLTTDLAGEAFDLIRNSPEECSRYAIFGRIDCVTILLDSERLTSDQRHTHINSTRTTVRSLLQSQTLRPGVPFVIALSKWDLIETHEREQVKADSEAISAAIAGNPVSVISIAAAPKDSNSVAPGYGLTDLLRTWLNADIKPIDLPDSDTSDAYLEPLSAFDRFEAAGRSE